MMESGLSMLLIGNNNQRLGVGATDLHRLDYMRMLTLEPLIRDQSFLVEQCHRDIEIG